MLQGINPQKILAVTFTNKAATELKERLGRVGIRGAKASTFHSLCYDILNRHYKELGYNRRPSIWSEDDELKAVFSESMRQVALLLPAVLHYIFADKVLFWCHSGQQQALAAPSLTGCARTVVTPSTTL